MNNNLLLFLAASTNFTSLGISMQDLRFTLSYLFAVLIGIIIRLGSEYSNNTLTKKKTFIQILFSFCLAYIYYISCKNYGVKINEIYLVLLSAFAIYIISAMDRIGQVGIKKYLQYKLKSFLAVKEEEEK